MSTLQSMLASNAPRKNRSTQPEHVPTGSSATRISKMSPRYKDKKSGNPYSWANETTQTLDQATRVKQQSYVLREQSDVVRASVERHISETRTTVGDQLKKRISELEASANEFDTQLGKISDEMQKLEAAREKAVAMWQARQGPLKVAESRLLVRSQRPQRELITDTVENALESEVKDIQNGLEQLSYCSKTALVELHKLDEQRKIIQEELDLKNTALEIDKQCLQVEWTSINKTPQPEIRVPQPPMATSLSNDDMFYDEEALTIPYMKGAPREMSAALVPTTPVSVRTEMKRNGRPKLTMHTPRFLVKSSEIQKSQWRANAETLLHTAQEVIHESERVRKSIRKVILGITQSNEDNLSATTEALIEKVDMTHTLQNKIQDQLESIDVELESLMERREKLVAAIQEKEEPLNVCRQRLALRRSRPAKEMVRDEVESALEVEIEELQKCVVSLEQKLDAIEIEERRLRETKTKLESDMADKQAAIQLDRQCLEIDVDNVDKQGIPLQSRPEGGDSSAASIYPTAMALVSKFSTSTKSNKEHSSSAVFLDSPSSKNKKRTPKHVEGLMTPKFMRSVKAGKDHSRRRWPKYGFAKDPAIPTHVKKELMVNFKDMAGGPVMDNYKRPTPPPATLWEIE